MAASTIKDILGTMSQMEATIPAQGSTTFTCDSTQTVYLVVTYFNHGSQFFGAWIVAFGAGAYDALIAPLTDVGSRITITAGPRSVTISNSSDSITPYVILVRLCGVGNLSW